MKKILRVSALVAAIALMFASCKSHEKCPAYGHSGSPKPAKEIRG
ncbi:MAG TPA: hypothetical protein PLU53_02735 [Bacteroidia bacterium]|nr:hypothetical protein [Bacteroidia bacterium]